MGVIIFYASYSRKNVYDCCNIPSKMKSLNITQVSDLGNMYAKKYSSTILPNKVNYMRGKSVDERNFSMGHIFAYLESKALTALSKYVFKDVYIVNSFGT